MYTKYKKHVVQYLFGLIEGSTKGLEEAIKDDFLIEFNIVPEKMEVIGTDRFHEIEPGNEIWIGTMTVTLIIDGVEFKVKRDWAEEYFIDVKHPDYEDESFFDSRKSYSHKKYLEIINSLNKSSSR
ncbi:hypothetical protein [Litoribaculum gwangyangense]|uniref:Uncharacterized protein n=1 Tax=Litoribaculum gwangyangense TaxID=1130722 RepID=A0ABP9BZ62_9FLAO